LLKAKKYLNFERKLEAAARRRERALLLKSTDSRVSNSKHDERVKRVREQRWLQDRQFESKSFQLASSSQDHLTMRKVRGDVGCVHVLFRCSLAAADYRVYNEHTSNMRFPVIQ
jgi:hypothetical protein